jgi:hypothetical protein
LVTCGKEDIGDGLKGKRKIENDRQVNFGGLAFRIFTYTFF